jgi:hypothetical protein
LNDREVLVAANTSTETAFEGEVIVDAFLNPEGADYEILFSNKIHPDLPGPVSTKAGGTVEIQEPEGGVTRGPARTVRIRLQAMEIQFLASKQ